MNEAHIVTLLPAFLNDALEPSQVAQVEHHLLRCTTCQAALAEWRALKENLLVITAHPVLPVPALPTTFWARLDELPPPTRAPAYQRWVMSGELVLAQLPLVRQQLWAASALVMGLGCLMAFWVGAGAGTVLALFAPLIAAAGVSGIYGPDNDPPWELALATPTSPRLILLARLTLVCGYDCLLALIASTLLVSFGSTPDGLYQLILRWLGPLLFLSAIGLVLSLQFGQLGGTTIALALWIGQVALTRQPSFATLDPTVRWVLALPISTNAVTLGLAVAIIAALVWWLPQQEQLAWT